MRRRSVASRWPPGLDVCVVSEWAEPGDAGKQLPAWFYAWWRWVNARHAYLVGLGWSQDVAQGDSVGDYPGREEP